MDETLVDQGVFVAQLPRHPITTVYTLVVDGLGWLAVGGFVVSVVLAIDTRFLVRVQVEESFFSNKLQEPASDVFFKDHDRMKGRG